MDHSGTAFPDRPFSRVSGGVAVRSAGQGAPMLLFHGGAGSWQHWAPVLDRLAEAFHVMALDLPGYGDSADLPADVTDDGFLDIVAGAIADLAGDAPVHLASFSFGSSIAAEMAARRPAADLSMIGAAGFGKPVGRGFTLGSRRKLRETLGREPTPVEIREVQADNLAKLMIGDRDKVTDWAIDMQDRNVARTRFDSRRISWADRTVPALARSTCPALMIYGEADSAATPSVAHRLDRARNARPDLQTAIIGGCGHWTMFEAPEETARLLLGFHTKTGTVR